MSDGAVVERKRRPASLLLPNKKSSQPVTISKKLLIFLLECMYVIQHDAIDGIDRYSSPAARVDVQFFIAFSLPSRAMPAGYQLLQLNLNTSYKVSYLCLKLCPTQ